MTDYQRRLLQVSSETKQTHEIIHGTRHIASQQTQQTRSANALLSSSALLR